MSVITFTDYVPAERADETPWTGVRVEEAADSAGPWTAIDTIVLAPVDLDPLSPAPRTFTTRNATLTGGWYQVVFTDALGDEDLTEPVQRVSIPFLPGLPDVGALLWARTKDTAGVRWGTFNANTSPTHMEADRLIVEAFNDVSAAIGTETMVPREAWGMAKSLIALRAAMLIELSYFPEQVATGRSPFDRYERMFNARLDQLAKVTGGEPQATWASVPVVSSTVDAAYRPGIFGADLAG